MSNPPRRRGTGNVRARATGAASHDSFESLLRYRNGTPVADLSNIMLVLAKAPAWRGVFGYDRFQSCEVFRNPPPFAEHYAEPADDETRVASMASEGREVPLTEHDYARISAWLSENAGISAKTHVVAEAVNVVCLQDKFHPVRDYILRVTWDGVRRVDGWLTRYCGAADSEYVRKVGTWWLISAVARVFDPGCKADYVMILEGPQGLQKSTVLKILAKDWFTDSVLNIGDKDGYMLLRGKWIVELAELDALKRVGAARAKQYFTAASDSYRPPYGRKTVNVPRQCVFAGTVNESTYLRDQTGDRRYWPVRCTRILEAELRKDVDQLWAEALKLLGDGTKHYPSTPEEDALCAGEQESRRVEDPWTARVRAHLLRAAARNSEDRSVSVSEVLDALNLSPDRQDSRASRRVSGLIAQEGWTYRRRPKSISSTRERAFFPPDDQEPPPEGVSAMSAADDE